MGTRNIKQTGVSAKTRSFFPKSGSQVGPVTDYSLWWSQAGSNRRPLACHASALPAELWPQYRRRERVTNGCQTVKPKLFDSAALDHPSFVEIRDYMICDRKHCGQPRRFDAEQVNEPGDSMTFGALNYEVLLATLRSRKLRADSGVSGSEFPGPDVWIVVFDCISEHTRPALVKFVVDTIDRHRIRAKSDLPANIQGDMDTQT